jgi:hypothetical protein
VEKAYFEEWKQEHLVGDDGIVYRYEVRNRASIRQLRTRMVPPPLRRTIIVACHASPMAAHSGVTRTMYRVITRFWWPYVARDITNGVLGSATCRLANHNSHEAQMHLHAFTCDELWLQGVLCVYSCTLIVRHGLILARKTPIQISIVGVVCNSNGLQRGSFNESTCQSEANLEGTSVTYLAIQVQS